MTKEYIQQILEQHGYTIIEPSVYQGNTGTLLNCYNELGSCFEVFVKHDKTYASIQLLSDTEVFEDEIISDWFLIPYKPIKTKPCEDSISRESVLEIIERRKSDCNFDVLEMEDAINKLPSVTPRHKGHWIEHEKVYECSECQIIRAKGMTGKYNYCPNCGAEMENVE